VRTTPVARFGKSNSARRRAEVAFFKERAGFARARSREAATSQTPFAIVMARAKRVPDREW